MMLHAGILGMLPDSACALDGMQNGSLIPFPQVGYDNHLQPHDHWAHDDDGRLHNGSLIRLTITSRSCLLTALPNLSASTASFNFYYTFFLVQESTCIGLCVRQSTNLHPDHHWSTGRYQSMLVC